jgi:hypothetical protein
MISVAVVKKQTMTEKIIAESSGVNRVVCIRLN